MAGDLIKEAHLSGNQLCIEFAVIGLLQCEVSVIADVPKSQTEVFPIYCAQSRCGMLILQPVIVVNMKV